MVRMNYQIHSPLEDSRIHMSYDRQGRSLRSMRPFSSAMPHAAAHQPVSTVRTDQSGDPPCTTVLPANQQAAAAPEIPTGTGARRRSAGCACRTHHTAFGKERSRTAPSNGKSLASARTQERTNQPARSFFLFQRREQSSVISGRLFAPPS